MEKKVIFLDGFMIPVTDALSKTISPGILSGQGVFETMRAYSGKIFSIDEHLQRLFQGLKKIDLQSPCSKQEMKSYLQKSLTTNKVKNARLRLMVWQGKGRMRISIAAFSYKPFSKRKYTQGFKVLFSDIRRDEKAVTSRIKSVNYLPLLMAQRKAKARGADEAILLNRRGFITEGSKTNIFFIKNNVLYTPSLRCGCLKGITRQIILKIARLKEIKCKQVMATPESLLEADEAFLTNSLVEIMPLTFAQGKPVGSGKVGPLTKQFCKAYQDYVKNDLSSRGTFKT
ncbi:MAG: aminotransferase class IV [Candidatus Aceula meridiana]|nr:aminotransferase class IV [Candidatus Aceula meridiana]